MQMSEGCCIAVVRDAQRTQHTLALAPTLVVRHQVHGRHLPELLEVRHEFVACKGACSLALLQQGLQLGQHLLALVQVQQVHLRERVKHM